MAVIRLVGYLKSIAGYHEKRIHLQKATVLREIISFPELDQKRIIVLVNEKGADFDTEITDTDEVKIFPVIGGGNY